MKINNITINQKFGYKPIVKQQKINNNSQDVFFTSIKKITEKKYNLEKQYGFSEEIRQYFNQDDISFDEIKKIILKYFPDFQVIENPCKTKEGRFVEHKKQVIASADENEAHLSEYSPLLYINCDIESKTDKIQLFKEVLYYTLMYGVEENNPQLSLMKAFSSVAKNAKKPEYIFETLTNVSEYCKGIKDGILDIGTILQTEENIDEDLIPCEFQKINKKMLLNQFSKILLKRFITYPELLLNPGVGKTLEVLSSEMQAKAVIYEILATTLRNNLLDFENGIIDMSDEEKRFTHLNFKVDKNLSLLFEDMQQSIERFNIFK